MTKTLHILQHTPGTPPGVSLLWGRTRGLNVDHRRLYLGDPVPAAHEVSNLVVCGGGINVDQEDRIRFLTAEKKLIEKCLRDDKKVMGLCLGGQLIADVLGAKVGPHKDWEIGWQDIQLQVQPGWAGFEAPWIAKFFQWHRYRFDLPKGAVRLAGNDWWENQAFRWGKNALGFQFHPEAESVWVQALANDPEGPTTGRNQDRIQMLELAKRHQPLSQLWFERVMEGFFLTNRG